MYILTPGTLDKVKRAYFGQPCIILSRATYPGAPSYNGVRTWVNLLTQVVVNDCTDCFLIMVID